MSKSALVAGKTLLKWKTNETPPKGEARKNYLKSFTKVKQGASEAILNEQVPPGYHDMIKKYFKTIDPNSKPDSTDSSGSDSSGGNDTSSQNP